MNGLVRARAMMAPALCVLAVIAATASCTSPGGIGSTATALPSASAPADVDEPPGTPPTPAAHQTGSDKAPAVSSDGTGGSTAGMTTSPPPTSTPSTVATGLLLPGGSAGVVALGSAELLTSDGKLILDRLGSSETGAAASTEALTRAMCAFVFGAPAEVATITRLPEDLGLDSSSGPRRVSAAPASTTLTCVYQSAGTPLLVLQLGDGPPIDPDVPGRPLIVGVGTVQAVLSYSPASTSAAIDPRLARDWLIAAISRVASDTV